MTNKDINVIDFIFVNFIVAIVLMGTLINVIEPFLPTVICQTFRYGKHAYKGVPNKFISIIEIPKSWFKHFYVFALLWSVWIFYISVNVYLRGERVPQYFITLIDTLCGSERSIRTSSLTTFIAIVLLTIQCIKRFFETHFVQVFSQQSKMNITHLLVGYFHYFGAFLTILAKAPSFQHKNDKQIPITFSLEQFTVLDFISIGVFIYAIIQQFRSNLILADLRKNNLGTVITEKHSIPTGGYFKYVSSPHMFFEILLYISLYGLLYRNTSWLFVMCWVITNQIENAWLTHKWYRSTFVNYPLERFAVIPNIL